MTTKPNYEYIRYPLSGGWTEVQRMINGYASEGWRLISENNGYYTFERVKA